MKSIRQQRGLQNDMLVCGQKYKPATMAKLLQVIFLATLISLSTQALMNRPRSISEAIELSDKKGENGLLNKVLDYLNNATADIEKFHPLVLRHVENSLRQMAEKVSKKRRLICSVVPKPHCDLG